MQKTNVPNISNPALKKFITTIILIALVLLAGATTVATIITDNKTTPAAAAWLDLESGLCKTDAVTTVMGNNPNINSAMTGELEGHPLDGTFGPTVPGWENDRNQPLTVMEAYGYWLPEYTYWNGAFISPTVDDEENTEGNIGYFLGTAKDPVEVLNGNNSSFFSHDNFACNGFPASLGTGVANFMLNIVKAEVMLSTSILSWSQNASLDNPESPIYPLGQSIEDMLTNPTNGLFHILYMNYLVVAIMVGAILTAGRKLVKQQYTGIIQSFVWMFAIITFSIIFLTNPLFFATAADKAVNLVNSAISDVAVGTGAAEEMCTLPEGAEQRTTRQINCVVWYQAVYVPWSLGQFNFNPGLLTQDTLTKSQEKQVEAMTSTPNLVEGKTRFSEDLLKLEGVSEILEDGNLVTIATSNPRTGADLNNSRKEAAKGKAAAEGEERKGYQGRSPYRETSGQATHDPATRNVFSNLDKQIESKLKNPTINTNSKTFQNWAFYQLDREQIVGVNSGMDFSEIAYNQLIVNGNENWGNAGEQKMMYSFFALTTGTASVLFIFAAGILLLCYKLGLIFLIIMAPIFLLLGTFSDYGRRLALRWAEQGVGLILKQIFVVIFLAVYLRIFAVLAVSDVPWFIRSVLIALLGIFMLIERKRISDIILSRLRFSETSEDIAFDNPQNAQKAYRNTMKFNNLTKGVAEGAVTGWAYAKSQRLDEEETSINDLDDPEALPNDSAADSGSNENNTNNGSPETSNNTPSTNTPTNETDDTENEENQDVDDESENDEDEDNIPPLDSSYGEETEQENAEYDENDIPEPLPTDIEEDEGTLSENENAENVSPDTELPNDTSDMEDDVSTVNLEEMGEKTSDKNEQSDSDDASDKGNIEAEVEAEQDFNLNRNIETDWEMDEEPDNK